MKRSALLAAVSALIFAIGITVPFAHAADQPTRWKITSVKICRTTAGAVHPTIEAIGTYPVYSFFIPRPVWTVNGTVVDAKPVYQQGRLVAFQLYGAGAYLEPGTRNTVKFALPDHNGSRVFIYDHSRIPVGQCYEFF